MDCVELKSVFECRACSRIVENLLTEEGTRKFARIYTELTSLQILEKDVFPITFCELCRNRLLEFEAFKKLCEQTFRLLVLKRKEKLSSDFSFEPLKQLQKSEKCYCCDLCGLEVSTKRKLCSHMEVHMTPLVSSGKSMKRSICCPRGGCSKKFYDDDRLQAHLRVHDGMKPEICKICGTTLKTLRILKRHLETHNTERNHKCSYCTKAFKTKAQLEVHERYIHKKERRFICQQCGAVFFNPTGLCTHVYNKHNPEKKHQCDECPKAFKSSFDLKDHKIRHTGKRNFVCEKCQKTFITQKDLKKHDRESHSIVDRSVQCKVCSMILKDKKTLKQHMFVHTGQRPHICQICDKGFTIRKALERHMTTHTGNRPFKCELCAKTFAERFYMNRHIERNHGVDPSQVQPGVQDRRFLSKLGSSSQTELSIPLMQ